MRNVFVIGLLIIIGNSSWSQIPKDDLHYYTLSEAQSAFADTIYAIDLSKNKLTILPQELEQFKNLKGLRLTKNKLETLPSFFGKFQHLNFLYLDKNDFTYFPAEAFNLSNLIYLDISRNKIGAIPAGIKNLGNLQYLDVWDNRFIFIDEGFAELQQLKYIDFRGTTFATSFVEKWTLAFPNTEIKFDNPCNCLD